MQIHPFSILMILVALLANVIVLTFTFQKKNVRAQIGALLMLSITVWIVGSALELSTTSRASKEIWVKFMFTGITGSSLIWLIYALYHANQIHWLTPFKFLLVSIPSVISLLLVYTNGQHGLVFPQVSLVQVGLYVIGEYDVGIGFWFVVGLNFLLDIAAMVVLLRFYFRTGRIFHWQMAMLFSAFLVPLGVYIFIDRFGISPRLDFQITPLVFEICVPIATILLDRLYQMDLMPFARDVVLENIADAVIVLNAKNQIFDLNRSARELFGLEGKKIIGASLEAAGIPLEKSIVNLQDRNACLEIQLENGKEQKHYTLRATPLPDQQGNLLANVIMLHDITDIKRRTLEISSLLESIQVVTSNLKLEDVLLLTAEHVTSALNADGCTLSYWDREKDAVVTWIEYRARDFESKDKPGTTYALSDFPETRFVLENQHPVTVNLTDPKADRAELEHMQEVETSSLLMLPLVVGEKVTGLVEIDHSRETRIFSPSDIRLAQALSDQAAIAIQNKMLLTETQRRLYEQTVLREAGTAISSALDLKVVLSQIAEQMCSAVQATSAYICDFDAQTISSSVLAEYISEEACEKEKESNLGVSYTELEQDFIAGLSQGLHDVSHVDGEDITEVERTHMQKFGAQSILYMPLRVKDQPIGFVEIWESRRRRDFTAEEISLCQAISQQAAIALDNAHLFEQAQRELFERKRIEEKLYYDATHDELTSLPNRKLFLERLGKACQQPGNALPRSFAVLFLDFDRFKVVNDSLGHACGDKLLIESARRIQDCLRPSDLLSRLGGDEFVILLEEINSLENVTRIADRIQAAIKEPFMIEEREVFISTSIGILFEQARNQRAEELIRDADIAMYRAKETGKARYVIFAPELRSEAVTRLELESALRQAIENHELAVYYQPIFALRNERLLGFEALVRWMDPEKGVIGPDKFIPLAEETGLIVQIDHWVLLEACKQMVAWQEDHPHTSSLTISVNLSGQNLSRPDLAEEIEFALKKSGMPPGQLRLEITESAIMQYARSTVTLLRRLQHLGVKLHIDDFGTGYSSLSYLHRFPLDALKIDRSFISNMQDSKTSSELVSTIISLAHTLNMTVVAEGVETLDQKACLERMECEEVQGFYYAKPMDKISIENLFLHNCTGRENQAEKTPARIVRKPVGLSNGSSLIPGSNHRGKTKP